MRPHTVILRVVAFGMLLTGCSDIYHDRRETVSFGAGEAVESNKVAHIIDPWPRGAGDRRLETDGQRMQRAVERYRTNKTYPLRTLSPSSVYDATPQGAATGQ